MFLVACGGVESPSVEQRSTCEVANVFSSASALKLDLLFVIDRSPAMADRQEQLAANLEMMMLMLEGSRTDWDLQLGVIAADLADDGRLLHAPRLDGCAPPADAFLRRRDRPRGATETNHAGTLAEAFRCIATLGASGPPVAQPLEALRAAVVHPDNVGFVRDDAFLGILIITGQDDASSGDVGAHHEALVAGKAHAGSVVGSAVAPIRAERLLRWVDAFVGDWGTFVPIERDDFSEAIIGFLPILYHVLWTNCLVGDLDTTDLSPEPGPQLGCTVTDVTGRGRSTEVQTIVPRCAFDYDGAPRLDQLPCWWARPEPERCSYTATQLELVVERAEFAAPGVVTTLRCAARCP
jgi:hypothetical protein